jgi:CheY-like chemotaxis protein
MRLPEGERRVTGTEPIRVLVADDEASLIEDYQYALVQPQAGPVDMRLGELHDELFGPLRANNSLPNIELVTVRQGQEAVLQVRRAHDENRPFSLAFLDVRMPPGINGVEAATQIREIDENIHIVIVTAYTDIQTVDLFQHVPPAHRLFLLQKPFHAVEIQQLATALSAKWQIERLAVDQCHSGTGVGRPASLDGWLQSLPGGIAVFDEDERIVQTNQKIENLFPELQDLLQVGTRYQAVQSGMASRLMPEKIQLGKDGGGTECHAWHANHGQPVERRLADNRWMMIAEHGLPSGGTVVQFHDITALKTINQRQAISSGMTQISRFAETLVDRLENAVSPIPRAVANEDDFKPGIVVEALLSHLIPLAQRQRLAPAVVMPDALSAEVASEASARLGDGIELEVVSTIGLWPVFADVARTKDALRALIDNAVEAMAGRGRIALETRNLRISRDAAADFPGMRIGDYVQISIADTGAGMTPDLIERAVMPFFTSKDPSAHPGLGLSKAYSFVIQSGGCLDIESDGHSGTCVSLFFPRTPASAAMTDSSVARH